ncbi:MAG: hypothetical protein JNL57_11110 [Bacteroidetes bacterium]|nr:hypothetical protein [Bacteroidota bacterium]
MKVLSSDWLTGHWGDEELPRYEFLSWLQSVYQDLDQALLFPVWEDGYAEYDKLRRTENGLKVAAGLQPREMTGLDAETMTLSYRLLNPAADAEMQTLLDRAAFARPRLKKALQRSKRLKEELMADLQFGAFGLHVLNNREGLLLTVLNPVSELWAWQYQTSVQTKLRYDYSCIRTRLLGKYRISLSNPMESIRKECLEKCGWQKSVVSTYVAESKTLMPVVAALKPLAVMKLGEWIENRM